MRKIIYILGATLISASAVAMEAPQYIGNYDAAVRNALDGINLAEGSDRDTGSKKDRTTNSFAVRNPSQAPVGGAGEFGLSNGQWKSPIDVMNDEDNYGGGK
jgi:hypothetical protein